MSTQLEKFAARVVQEYLDSGQVGTVHEAPFYLKGPFARWLEASVRELLARKGLRPNVSILTDSNTVFIPARGPSPKSIQPISEGGVGFKLNSNGVATHRYTEASGWEAVPQAEACKTRQLDPFEDLDFIHKLKDAVRNGLE